MGQRILGMLAGFAIALAIAAGGASAQKYGGTLQGMLSTDPPSLSIHDESGINVVWPMMPLFNNLVLYDPLVARESMETIVGELAQRWEWRADNLELAFTLKPGVRFHDGKPLTSRDVKHTFDVARGVSTIRAKFTPRRNWFENVREVATNGDGEVVFRIRRPQPSLLAMLATGWAPVYPAHIHPREQRIASVGTGPFKLHEYQRGRFLHYVKNADYHLPNRPYLDGIRFNVIASAATRNAALITNQVEIFDSVTSKPIMDALKSATKALAFTEVSNSAFQNIIFGTTRAPFNNPKLRQAVSLAIDRPAFVHSVYQDGMVQSGINMPLPGGAWGLPPERLGELPGYGDIEKNRARAREIMASLGYGPDKPLRIKLTSRNSVSFVEAAVWSIDALKKIWIEAELKQLEVAVWFSVMSRRDFDLAMNSTGISADDPDINFYENYGCDSLRNYSSYCNRDMQRRFDAQSQTFDRAQRLASVQETDALLVADVPRVVFGFRLDYHARWPYVKNFVRHQSSYNMTRMQEVWLDK